MNILKENLNFIFGFGYINSMENDGIFKVWIIFFNLIYGFINKYFFEYVFYIL